MSVAATTWVWEHSQAKGSARLVLLALADHAGQDGGDAYPSITRLSERCGLCERTVQDSIKTLTELGEIVVEKRCGRNGTNRYRLPLRPAESAPPQDLHPAESAPSTGRSRRVDRQTTTPEPANPAPKPTTNQHLTVPEPKPREAFDVFWSVYPAKVGKGAAKRAFPAALAKAGSIGVLVAGVMRYRDDPNRSPRFTKHPATWLNGECWDDQPIEGSNVSPSTRSLASWALRHDQGAIG